MRVKDLVQRLRDLPAEYQNAIVVVQGGEKVGIYDEADEISLLSVHKFGEFLRQGPGEPAIEIQPPR